MKDIAAANDFFATQSEATGVFNVAYGRRLTINELARIIRTQTGSRSAVEHAPERAGDVKHSVASIDKLRAAGFNPSGSLQQGLADTIACFETRGQGEGRSMAGWAGAS